MDLRKLKKLIDLVEDSGIAELELTEGEEKIRIVKAGVQNREPYCTVTGPASGPAPVVPPDAVASLPPATPPEPEDHIIKSPMVGTYYRCPSPGAKSFVEVGDSVKKGQTVCIIEAMKLMNELECETAGTIAEICIENGEPVEYGQVLFRIDPA